MSSFLNRFVKNSEKGSLLAETMIGVSLLSGYVVISMQQNSNLTSLMRQQKAKEAYASVINDINSAASSFKMVLFSIENSNSGALKRCIEAGPSKNCSHTDSNQAGVGFDFYSVENQLISGNSSANAAFYDSNGDLCTPSPTKDCIMKAYTSLKPICFNNESSCSVAFNVIIELNVEPVFNKNFWISEERMPKPVVAEIALNTHLVTPLEYIDNIKCNDPRHVLQGVSHNLDEICVEFPERVVGPQGPPGVGDTGPKGHDATCPGSIFPHG